MSQNDLAQAFLFHLPMAAFQHCPAGGAAGL